MYLAMLAATNATQLSHKDQMMKNTVLNLVAGTAFSMLATYAGATGLVAIPATGFSTSAYTLCNTTGNFGSGITISPTTSANNTCAAFPTNEAVSPVSGYTLIASMSRNAIINGVTIGAVVDRIWRNSAKTSCIFGARFTALNADWDISTAGTQYFKVNDILRGGFSEAANVNAGYFVQATNASPVYRIGRTFTSVQHRAYNPFGSAAEKEIPGANYLALPTIGGDSALVINGESTISLPTSTTSSKQTAIVNSNWIDFTLDTYYLDPFDFSTSLVSPTVYVEAACDSSSPSGWVKSGAIRLRQTGQEGQTLIEVLVDGYAPPGATVP